MNKAGQQTRALPQARKVSIDNLMHLKLVIGSRVFRMLFDIARTKLFLNECASLPMHRDQWQPIRHR